MFPARRPAILAAGAAVSVYAVVAVVMGVPGVSRADDVAPSPSASPTATPSPSPAGSSTPSPTDSPTSTPTPPTSTPPTSAPADRPSSAAAHTPARTAITPRHVAPVAAKPAVSVPSSSYLVFTAESLTATGLAYGGPVTAHSVDGSAVPALRLTFDSAQFAQLSMAQPCAASRSLLTTSTSTAAQGATFDIVTFDATLGTTPLSFSVASPPVFALPPGVTLTNVRLTIVTASADSLSASGFHNQVATC